MKSFIHKWGVSIAAVVVGLSIAVSAGHASAQERTKIMFPSLTCFDEFTPRFHCDKIELTAYLVVPQTATDKIVLISHGTGGVDARHFEYADSLVGAGIAALVIDHWTDRHIGKVHQDYAGNQSKGGRAPTMNGDAVLAVDWLNKNHPEFKRFGYMGESMGGSSATNLAKPWPYALFNRAAGTNVRPFDAIVALYPGCFDRTTEDHFNKTPFLFVLGEKDDDAPATQCVQYSDWMNEHGGQSSAVVLAGEHHDFDGTNYREYFPKAQNPAECSKMLEPTAIVWEKTGERFPRTPAGLQSLLSKCMKWGLTSGHGDNRFVGVPYWLEFFKSVFDFNHVLMASHE